VPTSAAAADPAWVKIAASAGNVYVVPAAGATETGIGTTLRIDATAMAGDRTATLATRPAAAATSSKAARVNHARLNQVRDKDLTMPSRSIRAPMVSQPY
jgi:hypothetical protein